MELPQLVVELVGDYSKLMEDIKRARVEAVKQAQFLEKDLNLTIGVNDDSLKNLNKHFDLKVTHFKQTQTYFKNNPLKVYVDDRELTNLNKELSLLSGGSGNRARVSVDVEVNKEKANLIINNNNNSREIVGQLKSVEKAVIDSAKLSLGQSLGTGITEEFGRTISKNLMSGFKKNLGLDVAGATQSFTRAVSKPLSKVNPESVQKFEDDMVSALEEAFVFKNQSQAEEKFKAAFQPIVSEIQEIAYAAAGQVLKVGAQPLRIRKRVLLAQSAQEAAKMSENVNVPDNEDIKKAKSISLITGGIDFQEGGLNTFFAENLVKRVLPGSYSVPVTNPYSNDKNNLGQIYQFRSNLSNGQMVVGADGVERPASEPMPLDMLLHTNLEKGYNPDSVKMAAEAIAYRKKYPDKPIQLAGTSGGSYVVEEAIAILERAGITNVKGLGLTAPVNNLMTTASQANYRSLVGEFDPLNVAMFGGKNVTDKEHPVYKETVEKMPFGMPGLLEESPLMSLIPAAGRGHALLPFLVRSTVSAEIQSFLGDAINPISPSFSKGLRSEPNLHFFKSQLDEKDSLVRTFKAVMGDSSTLRQIQKAGFSGADGYTFAVPQKPDWRREHDFSSMMGNLPEAKNIGKDVKPEFDEYTAFLEEMRAGIVEFLDSGAKSKQSLAKTLEKAIKFYPELKTLQTRVLETLGEQARLTDLNKNPKKDTRTAREKYTDNQRLARINAQFPQGQEYLKDFKDREKDADLSPEARSGLESARNIATQFNKSFATLQTLTKSGNLDEAAKVAATIKQIGVRAREEIKLITKSLGESNNVGSTRLGSQLGQTLGQISNVQKKTDRVISVNKLTLPNTVSVGENTIDGMRQGIEKELEKLKTTAEKIPNTVTDVVTEKLQMQSPSKVMEGYGENTGDGYGIGLEKSLNRVKEIAKSEIDDIAKSFDLVNQNPKLNSGEELTSNLHDWYLSHRTQFDPSKLNNILDNGLVGRPPSDRAAKELELFGRSGTIYSALRHKRYGVDNIKNEGYGGIEFLIDPSRTVNKTTWLPQDSDLERYQSIEKLKEYYGQRGLQFRKLNSVSPKASLMKNYEQNSGYVEAQTHTPILPSDISAIRIGSSQISPDQLFKKHGDSLLAFIRAALSKNIKVIGDFSPEFLKVAESAGININRGLSEGIRKSANKPVEAIGEVAHKTVKATEGYPVPIQQISKKPSVPEAQQAMMDEFNKKLAALQGIGKNAGGGLSVGIDNSLKNVKSSSEKLANTVINTVEEKLEIKSPSRWGIRMGKYVGEGFTKGLQFLEGGNNGIIPTFIRIIDGLKSAVESGDITSSAERFKDKLSRGFSKGLGSIPGFAEAKERFKVYMDFLKKIANPNVSLALGEGLANGIVAAKELFVDFLKMPEKLVEGFNQAKVAFDSFVKGMSKVQKFGEMMDFLKSSIGNVVKVLGLLVVGKIILDLAPASIEVAANFENLERRIKFTSGSISEGAKNIAFLRSEAKRLNVDLSQTLESGSKFFQATKDTPLEGYQSRQIVSAVTQASAVYGLDLDKQQRTFTALEQMSGKTVVSQEELRQQLAEAIPNASQIAANAYGTTTQSMNQLLSTGRVLAEDFLPKFAQQLKAQTSSGVGDAVNSSVAITNRFNNSLIELQESVGKTLLPFRNFSLSVFASGIDLVTKNFGLLNAILLITLAKLGSPVWGMFGGYLKEIAFSGNLAKGALLGIGQGIATLSLKLAAAMAIMKAFEIGWRQFTDTSGAIGEQTKNVTQSVTEQRKKLNITTPARKDPSYFDRLSLILGDGKAKQLDDSTKRVLEGQQNSINLISDANSPAIQKAIQDIQFLDKSLDKIKMERRAIIANNPGNSEALRGLQEWEKKISKMREKPLELFGGTKANLDKQVETLKTYLEYFKEVREDTRLNAKELTEVDEVIELIKEDLAAVTAEQDRMTKAIKNSLTEMQKFAIEIRNLEAKFNDLRQGRDIALSLEKTNLFNLGSNGGIQPGQVEYTNNLKTQENLIGKIADNLKQIQEMSAQLEINGLDGVLSSLNLSKSSGIDTLKAAQERSIDGSKEKEILTNYVKVREMQAQTVDMQQQIAEQKYNLTQSLYQQNKQIQEYYLSLNKQAQEITQVYKELVNTNNLNTAKNKIRSAVLGYQDNFITRFADGIIQILDTLNQPVVALLQGQREIDQAKFNLLNEKRQIQETQRSNLSPITPGNGKVTSEFGWRTIFGQRQHHNGIDYGVPIGTPVKAPTSGEVSNVFNDAGGGLTVTLSNINAAGQKVEQSFLHLSQSLVKIGDVVQKGQVIAKSGNSGSRTTGAHLDYRVKVDGKYINPRDFLKSSVNPPVAKNTSTPPRQTPTISTNLASKKNAWQQFTNWLMPPAVAANPNQEKNLKKTFKKGHGEFRPSSSSSFANPNLTKLLDEYKYNIRIREDKIVELKQIQSKYDPKKDRIHYIGLQSLINGLTIQNKIISRLSQDTQKGLLTESRYVSKLISIRDKEVGRFLEANSNFSRLGRIYLSRKVPGISWLAPKVDIPLPSDGGKRGADIASLVQKQKDLLDGTGRATSKPSPNKKPSPTQTLQKNVLYELIRRDYEKELVKIISKNNNNVKKIEEESYKAIETIASRYKKPLEKYQTKYNSRLTYNLTAGIRQKYFEKLKPAQTKISPSTAPIASKPSLKPIPVTSKPVTVLAKPNQATLQKNPNTRPIPVTSKPQPTQVAKPQLPVIPKNLPKPLAKDGSVEFAAPQPQPTQGFVSPQLQQAERNLENTITNAQTKINIEASQSYITATAQENKELMALDRARMENRRSPIGVFREIEDMGLNLSQQNPERELRSQKFQIKRNEEDKLHQITMAKFDQEQIKGANEDLLKEVRKDTRLRPRFKIPAIKQLELAIAESKKIIEEYDEYLKLVPELIAAATEKADSEYLISENLRKFSLKQQISQAQASGLRSKSRGNLQLNAQADLMDLNSKYAGEISGLDEEIRKEANPEIVKLRQEQKKLALIAALRDSSNIQRNLKIQERDLEFSQKEKLNSSNNAISSEVIKGKGLFGIKDKNLEKAQALSQIKMDFERERMEIEKFSLSMNLAAEDTQKLTNNLNKLNELKLELKLDNVAKEFNMFTEAISGVKGDFDNILKGFIMNDSVSKNAGDLQGINKSLDDIAKKRRDIIMNTSGNIQEVRNAYQNPGNNERLKELDRAQRDLEKKKTELGKRSIGDAFSEIGKSILSNLASVASKELSNQLFGKLTEFIFGKKNETGAAALNTAGSKLSSAALMLKEAALALRGGGGDNKKRDAFGGLMGMGGGSFGILEGSSATPFASSGEFDFSSGFDLGGGLDFGSATLPSFAKGGMVGDLLNKERAISGFNPHLIIANEGERVLTPKETKLWNQLNSSNKLESFSGGGMVGQGLGNINNVGRSGDTINITPNVNINNEGGGNINKDLFEKALEAKIQETIKQERRPGGSLNRGGLYDR